MHFFLSNTDCERSQLNATKISSSRLIHLTVKRNIYCSLAKKVEDGKSLITIADSVSLFALVGKNILLILVCIVSQQRHTSYTRIPCSFKKFSVKKRQKK